VILASVGVLDTTELIAREYNSEALTQYLSMGSTPHSSSLFLAFASVYLCSYVNCLFTLSFHSVADYASCFDLACV